MLLDLQRAFRATVTSADNALVTHVLAAHGSVAGRVGVYRNTVQKSLVDVLAVAFPVVQRIVGERFFAALARDYAIQSLPDVPQLSIYGSGFADFIASHDRTQDLPYLSDVARLEWARGETYFAADAAPLNPAKLGAVPMEKLSNVKLLLHPAARLVRSTFPIHRIWAVNQSTIADVPAVDMSIAESVLITRPQYEVIVRQISNADAAFVSASLEGCSLNDATVAALAADDGFDLQAALQAHFLNATFAAIAL